MRAKQLTRLSFLNAVEPRVTASKALRLSKQYPENLNIRTMTFQETEWTRELWAGKGEGWSSSVGGLLPNYNQDNEGIYIMELNGEAMGSISMITYPELNMAFVGYYIVREPHRKKGYGRILMEEVLEHTEKDRGIKTFGLDCAQPLTPMYEKFGFRPYTTDDFWALKFEDKKKYEVTFNEQALESVRSFPTALLDYDKSVYGDSRRNYLYAMCSKPSTFTVICEEAGKLTGYGVISERIPPKEEPQKSYRIGPLCADNPETAEEILKGLISSVPATPTTIYLETPGKSPSTAELLVRLGFTKSLTVAKMYRGEPPKHDEAKIICYSSVAFG